MAKLLSQPGQLRQNRVFSVATYVVMLLYWCIRVYAFLLTHSSSTCWKELAEAGTSGDCRSSGCVMTPLLPNIRPCGAADLSPTRGLEIIAD